MQTEHRVLIRYSEPLLRKAVRIFVWRGVVRRRWWLWGCPFLLIVLGLVGGWNAGPPWSNGVFIVVLLLVPGFFAAFWRIWFVSAADWTYP
jgi:hypothetical protein